MGKTGQPMAPNALQRLPRPCAKFLGANIATLMVPRYAAGISLSVGRGP